ncbi:streptophobe family protein [Streptomyces tropicalis]|uniref:Streptophobe family protein n=1 Tax=Streptomyces tropicalis TaxID=3034234 RepID=A0ABT6A9H6_9ACTN|nr:streptophobe family protein [Streptomyces tropicalis]MDF3301298.1 streptophobe family protein [Streptomyces tropicalis]
MSQPLPTAPPAARHHGWLPALATALAGLVSMGVVAALGLWAAGAAALPGGAFPRVVAATVVTAVGGSVALSGDAGALARSHAGITVMPLSVTLTGALVVAAGFLRPLRHRAVASVRELGGWAVRIALVWLLLLLGLALGARQTFSVDLGNGVLGDIGDLLGAAPEVGFRARVPATLAVGLVWLAGVMVLALMVARGAPLPARLLRFQASVRPAAYAMVTLLLVSVALGVVVALITAVRRGHPADSFAVILLGLPNVVWPALTIGMGAAWHGRVDGPFGLPMPYLLDEVLRTPDVSTLDLGTLAAHDGRAWWLVAVDAVLLVGAAFLMAARSPAGTRAPRHVLHMAVALVAAVLAICLLCRVSAHYGLSLLGIGDAGGGLSGELLLRPQVWSALGLAVAWGMVAGLCGALAARPVRRRGETGGAPPPGARPW